MTLLPTKDAYSATITVTDRPWSKRRFITVFARNAEDASAECLSEANREGWVAPTWWQWWRRRDSKEPFVAGCL